MTVNWAVPRTRRCLLMIALGLAAGLSSGTAPTLWAQGQPASPQQLVYAIYSDTSTAARIFPTVTAPGQPAAASGAFAAVTNQGQGQVTIQQRKSSGLAQTALLSGIIGLLGPQGAAQRGAGAPTGGTAVDSLRSSLVPGTSAVVAIVDTAAAPAVAASLQQANPQRVMSERVAPSAP